MTLRLSSTVAIITGATEGIGLAVSHGSRAEGARSYSSRAGRSRASASSRSLAPRGRHSWPATSATRPRPTCGRRRARSLRRPRHARSTTQGSTCPASSCSTRAGRRAPDLRRQRLRRPAMLQAAARAMRETGGAIVNVTSRAALVGLPGSAVYGASKGALESLTRGAAIELAPHGIRVNSVAPGLTETPMIATWVAEQPDPEAFRAACRPTSRRAGWRRPTTSPRRSASWPATRPARSRAPASPSTAATRPAEPCPRHLRSRACET